MEANVTRTNLFPVFVGIAAIVAVILVLYGRGII
jgi:hypothetical protein